VDDAKRVFHVVTPFDPNDNGRERVGIPVKLNARSGGKPNGIPG
jgi:hypothetical protein